MTPQARLRRVGSSETMPVTVKAPLRPFEYMAWAKSVPGGARYNLAQSGIEDFLRDPPAEGWNDTFSVRDLSIRDYTGDVFYPLLDRSAVTLSIAYKGDDAGECRLAGRLRR